MRGDDAAKTYNAASGFFNMGRFDFAAEEYARFVQQYPRHPQIADAKFFLGESYFQLKDHKRASEVFDELVQKHSEFRYASYALFRLGESYCLLEDYAAAEPVLARFTERYPEDPLLEMIMPYLGRAQLGVGKLSQARRTLERSLRQYPEGKLRDRNRYDLAVTLERLHETADAVQLYRKVASTPASELADDAELALGIASFRGNQFEEAIRIFQELEQKFPQSPLLPTARLNRALSLYQTKAYDQAEALLESQSSEDGALSPEVWYWLGMTRKAAGKNDDAVATLLQGYEEYPQSPEAPRMLYHMADAHFQMKDFEKAYSRYLELAEKYPQSDLVDDGLSAAAESARMGGKLEDVYRLARKFYEDFPKSPWIDRVALTVGQTLSQQNRTEEALKYFAALLERDPESATGRAARYHLALAYNRSGKAEDVLRTLAPLLQDESGGAVVADAHYLAGSCQFEAQEFDEAARLFQRYLELRPDGEVVGHALSYLCVSLSSVGRFEEVEGVLDRLQERAEARVALPAMLRVAHLGYEAKRYDVAAGAFQRIAQSDAAADYRARAVSGMAWCNYQQGLMEEAAAGFARIVKEHPEDKLAPEAGFMKGRALELARKTAEAVTAYEEVLKLFPATSYAFDATLQTARMQQAAGQAGAATETYRRLLAQYPKHERLDVVYNELAWVYLSSGENDPAVRTFETLLDQYPTSDLVPEATLNLCEPLFQSGKYAEVVQRLTPLLDLPLKEEIREAALYRLARTHAERDNWKEAGTRFQELVQRYPSSGLRREGEFWIAEADRQCSRYADAAERLKRLVSEPGSEPWLGLAWLRLAQSYGEQKKWKEMLATTQELRRRFPGFGEMHAVDYHAGRALQSLARFDEARGAYHRAVGDRSDENAARSQFMIGETYFHQRRYRDALRELLKVEILYDYPEWQAASLLEAAKCHEMLGEWGRAAETYRRILKKYPATEHAAEANQRLEIAVKRMAG